MPRNSKKAADEFKIEQIQGSRDETDSGDLKRSLVFRIFKRSVKSITKDISTPHMLAIQNSNTLAEKDISEENSSQDSIPYSKEQDKAKNPYSPVKKCNKLIQSENPLKVKFITKQNSELRRTSRRIVLRVNKDFIGTDCIKMGRRKKYRKSVPTILKEPEVVRRGRGRPRLNKEKPAMKPPKAPRKIDDGTVWTLVPKEVIDSEYFKSQIIRVHYPQDTTSRNSKFVSLPPKTIPSLKFPSPPFQNRANLDLKSYHVPVDPNTEIVDQNQVWDRNQVLNEGPEKYQKSSSRPTVIFFKPSKNYSNCVNENSASKETIIDCNSDFNPIGGLPVKNAWQIDYLSRKYGKSIDESAIEYIYGVTCGNIRKTEELFSDVLSGKKLLITENDGQLRITNKLNYQLQTLKLSENDNRSNKRCPNSANNVSSAVNPYLETSKEYPDTLFRQVIINSLRLLYDEESVLGYT